jgi:myo-inositol 2-dehydrogenase/D-chiro-inositol 1-dehydrogenase
MNGVVRIGLVGLGDIAMSAHLPALLRSPDVRLVAVVDPDRLRRDAARLATDAPAFATMADAMHGGRLDAVVLATPPWVTTGLIVDALESGHHVLAEKPVATSVARATPLAELPADLRCRLQVGLTYRHDPAIGLLREWIHSGRLGSPLLVRAHIYDERKDPGDPAHLTRLSGTLAHGTPVVHEGAHVLDWLAHLLGGHAEAVEEAWSLRTDPELPAANLTGARLRYPGDTVALVEFGWLTEALPRCEITLLGDSGLAVLDGRTFRLELRTGTGTEVVEFAGDRVTRCFDRQLGRFVDLVTGRSREPSPNLSDALDALELSERIAGKAAR